MILALHRYVTPLPALRRVPSQPGNLRSEQLRRCHEYIPRREPCRKTGKKPLLPYPDGVAQVIAAAVVLIEGTLASNRRMEPSRACPGPQRSVSAPGTSCDRQQPLAAKLDPIRPRPIASGQRVPHLASDQEFAVRTTSELKTTQLPAPRSWRNAGSNNGCRNGRTQLLDPTPAATKPPAGGSARTVESRMLATRGPSGSSTVGAWRKNANARSMSSLRAAQWGQSAK